MKFYIVPLVKLSYQKILSRESGYEDMALEMYKEYALLPRKGFVIQQAKSEQEALFLVRFERIGCCSDHHAYEIDKESPIIELPGDGMKEIGQIVVMLIVVAAMLFWFVLLPTIGFLYLAGYLQ